MRLRRTETIAESEALDLEGAATLTRRDLAADGAERPGRRHHPLAIVALDSGLAIAYRIDDERDPLDHAPDDFGEEPDEDDAAAAATDEERVSRAALVHLDADLVIERGPFVLPPLEETPVRWCRLAAAGDAVAALVCAGTTERAALSVLGPAGEGLRGSAGPPPWTRDARGAGPALVWVDGAGDTGGVLIDRRGQTRPAPRGFGLPDPAPVARIEAFGACGGGYLIAVRAAEDGARRLIALDENLRATADPVEVPEGADGPLALAPIDATRALLLAAVRPAAGEESGRTRACAIRIADGQPAGAPFEIATPFEGAMTAAGSGLLLCGAALLPTPDEVEPRRAVLAAAFCGLGRRRGRTVEVAAEPERDYGPPVAVTLPGGAVALAAAEERGEIEVRLVRATGRGAPAEEAAPLEEFVEVGGEQDAEDPAAPASIEPPASFDAALAAAGEPVAYTTALAPRPGDWVRHPRFGPGLVLQVRGGIQARVLFADGERLLACGR